MRRIAGSVLVCLALLAAVGGCFLFNSPPVAEFTSVLTQRSAPCEVIFDASASHDPDGIIVKYEWSFGNGATGAGEEIRHTYPSSGTFEVSLIVTDNRGKTATASDTVTVLEPYTPIPLVVAHFTSCREQSGWIPCVVCFDASTSRSSGGIVDYEWSFGDGMSGTGQKACHSYLSRGSYDVSLTVTDNQGRSATTIQAIVIARPSSVIYAVYEGSGYTQSPIPLPPGIRVFFIEGVRNAVVLDSWGQHVKQLAEGWGVLSGGGYQPPFFLDVVGDSSWTVTVIDLNGLDSPFPPQTYTGCGPYFSLPFRLVPGNTIFNYTPDNPADPCLFLVDYSRLSETPLAHEMEVLGGTYLLRIRRGCRCWTVSVGQ